MARSSTHHARTRRGFTLVEVMVAAAVLAMAVVAVTQAVVAGQMQTYEAMHGSRAVALAEALLDEVLALPYTDPDGDTEPGPDRSENQRRRFDAADDFHGYTEAAGELEDADGDRYPQPYQRFSRTVAAEYQTQRTAAFGDQDGLLVTVTVTDERGLAWTLRRFIPDDHATDDEEEDEDNDSQANNGDNGNHGEGNNGNGHGGGDDDDDDDRDDDDDDRGRGRGRGR